MIGIVLVINLFLRLVFILYGYIATEEGILLYNQQLAYSGRLPFIDYDAWSSLFHDYLLGWQQLIFGASLIGQRFIGLGISLLIFWLILAIVKKLVGPKTVSLTGLLLTLGSLRYLYTSTIPYSEQFMTLFILLALFFLLHRRPASSFLAATAAGLVRSQALPITFLFWLYLVKTLPRQKWLLISLFSLTFAVIVLLPFLLTQPSYLFWAFFWPLQADKILVYQHGTGTLTPSSLVNFVIELARDYGLLLLLASFSLLKLRKSSSYIWLLSLTVLTQLGVALFHKPPFASYIYPFVPLLVILASLNLKSLIQPRFLVGLLLLQFILFPHSQFLKTSLSTFQLTPHHYLNQIATYLQNVTSPNAKIISFYIPVNVVARRPVLPQFVRDRFSLTTLPQSAASQHHLVTLDEFRSLISSQTPDALIFTDKTHRVFGINAEEQQATLALINKFYYPAKNFSQISLIEDPKTKNLYFYLPR